MAGKETRGGEAPAAEQNPAQPPEVMRLVGELSHLFRGEVRRACGENGVPYGYRALLFHLARCDGQTQRELAEKTGLRAATVSVTVEKMERDGYVKRTQDSADKRGKRVYLTEKGKEVDRRNREKVDRLEKQFASAISREERQTLSLLLEKIMRGYETAIGRAEEGGDGER